MQRCPESTLKKIPALREAKALRGTARRKGDVLFMRKSALRKQQKERRAAAARELSGIQAQLDGSYALLNQTADPALLEACILEISALQSRYGNALRGLKSLYQEG